jgi:hypothetical protein
MDTRVFKVYVAQVNVYADLAACHARIANRRASQPLAGVRICPISP